MTYYIYDSDTDDYLVLGRSHQYVYLDNSKNRHCVLVIS